MTVKWSAFSSGSAISGSDVPVGLQSAANVQWTWSQVLTYVAAGTATLTNKTFDTAGTGNSFSINGVAATTNTGTGAVARATSPSFTTPALGTPSAGVLTSCTGLPISTGVSGLGTGVATFLATPSSTNLASAVTDETGSGALVFATSPTLVTPVLGAATATSVTASGLLQAGTTLGISTDVLLNRDAANTLALRNGTSAQQLNIYSSYTDSSNYEQLRLAQIDGGGDYLIGALATGTGTERGITLRAGSTTAKTINFQTGSGQRWQVAAAGHFLTANDNSYDIGASGATRPRNGYFGSALIAGTYIKSASTTVASLPSASTSGAGSRSFVTDATVTTFASTVAGGGSNKVPVVSDGTNWLIG